MSEIQITNDQRDAAIAVGDDFDNAFEFGIVDEAGSIVSPPLADYGSLTSPQRQAVKDSMKQQYTIVARQVLPIGSSTATFTSGSYTTETMVGSIAFKTFTTRRVMVTLSMSAYTDIIDTRAGYFIKLNDVVAGPELFYYFNTVLDHRCFSGSWVIDIPPGTSIISAFIRRDVGTGSIIQDTNDFNNLSALG